MKNLNALVAACSLVLCLGCRADPPVRDDLAVSRLELLSGRSTDELRALRQPGSPLTMLQPGRRSAVNSIVGRERHAAFLARLEARGFRFGANEPKTDSTADALSDADFDSARAIYDFVGGPDGTTALDDGVAAALSIPWQVLDRGADMESLITAARTTGSITPEAEARVRDYVAAQKTHQ